MTTHIGKLTCITTREENRLSIHMTGISDPDGCPEEFVNWYLPFLTPPPERAVLNVSTLAYLNRPFARQLVIFLHRLCQQRIDTTVFFDDQSTWQHHAWSVFREHYRPVSPYLHILPHPITAKG